MEKGDEAVTIVAEVPAALAGLMEFCAWKYDKDTSVILQAALVLLKDAEMGDLRLSREKHDEYFGEEENS